MKGLKLLKPGAKMADSYLGMAHRDNIPVPKPPSRLKRWLRAPALKTAHIVLRLGLVYLALATISLFPVLHVDYPCFVRLDEKSNCVLVSDSLLKEHASLAVYLSRYSYRTLGGSCYSKSSVTGSLAARTGGFTLLFDRVGREDILVNGKELGAGETYSAKSVFTLDPWTISTTTFTNLGSPSRCETKGCQYAFPGLSREEKSEGGFLALCNSTPERIIVSGETNSHLSLIKGLSSWAIMLLLFFWVRIRLKRRASLQNIPGEQQALRPLAHFTLIPNAAKVIGWAVLFSVPLLNDLRFIIPNFDRIFFTIEWVILPLELAIAFCLSIPDLFIYALFSNVRPWWAGGVAIPLFFDAVFLYVLVCILHSFYKTLKSL